MSISKFSNKSKRVSFCRASNRVQAYRPTKKLLLLPKKGAFEVSQLQEWKEGLRVMQVRRAPSNVRSPLLVF